MSGIDNAILYSGSKSDLINFKLASSAPRLEDAGQIEELIWSHDKMPWEMYMWAHGRFSKLLAKRGILAAYDVVIKDLGITPRGDNVSLEKTATRYARITGNALKLAEGELL